MIDYDDITPHLRAGLRHWIADGILPGYFLLAVLRNDLRGAYRSADEQSMPEIMPLVSWMTAHAPDLCWGSTWAVADWQAHGGLNGIARMRAATGAGECP